MRTPIEIDKSYLDCSSLPGGLTKYSAVVFFFINTFYQHVYTQREPGRKRKSVHPPRTLSAHLVFTITAVSTQFVTYDNRTG